MGGMQACATLGAGLQNCALGSLFPLDNATVSPLWEPEDCVSNGRSWALLRWMHLGTGAMPGQVGLTGDLGVWFAR